MNSLEKKMCDILKRCIEHYGVDGTKAEFEAEGTRTDELLRLMEIANKSGAKVGLKINQDGKKRSAYSVLGYKDSNWEILELTWPELKSLKLDHKIKKQIQTNAFYEKYIGRQLLEIEELKKEKELRLNESIDFDKCSGLSNEIKEILKRNKPKSIGEARELVGMTPAAASILLRFVKK